MQRIKDEGQNPSKPNLSQGTSPQDLSAEPSVSGNSPVSMTNPAVKRSITLQELQAHHTKENPWFAVDGEVGFPFGFLLMTTDPGVSGL